MGTASVLALAFACVLRSFNLGLADPFLLDL